jgi:hypothetical protein
LVSLCFDNFVQKLAWLIAKSERSVFCVSFCPCYRFALDNLPSEQCQCAVKIWLETTGDNRGILIARTQRLKILDKQFVVAPKFAALVSVR